MIHYATKGRLLTKLEEVEITAALSTPDAQVLNDVTHTFINPLTYSIMSFLRSLPPFHHVLFPLLALFFVIVFST